MNLEQSALSLQEQFHEEQTALVRRERILERFGRFAFGGFIVILFVAVLAIIYMIVTNLILSGTQPVVGVLLALFIVFAVLTLTYVIFAEDLKEKRKAMMKIPSATDPPSRPDTARLLNEGDPQPLSSVVEGTTDLLPIENRTRKL
jgi:hypothetical protein